MYLSKIESLLQILRWTRKYLIALRFYFFYFFKILLFFDCIKIAFLMGNQGLCQSGHLCYDPFVGSGSILVSAAKFGAYVIGSDIDYLMVHGKTKPSRIAQTVRGENECIKENLKQINCESLYLDGKC